MHALRYARADLLSWLGYWDRSHYSRATTALIKVNEDLKALANHGVGVKLLANLKWAT
jgi:hypothetical protein